MRLSVVIFVIFQLSCREGKKISIYLSDFRESEVKNVYDVDFEFQNHTSLKICIVDFWWPYPPYTTKYFVVNSVGKTMFTYFHPMHPPNIPDSLRIARDSSLLDGYKMRNMCIRDMIILDPFQKKIVHGKLVKRIGWNDEFFKKGNMVRVGYVPNNISYINYPEFIYRVRLENLHFLNFSDTIYSNFVDMPYDE